MSADPHVPEFTAQRSGKTSIKAVLFPLIVLALFGCSVYLMSMINFQLFFLVAEGNELVVKRGAFFPTGRERFVPSDPRQNQLYQRLDRPAGMKPGELMTFENLSALEHELIKHLLQQAKPLISSRQEWQYAKGKALLERARKLLGQGASEYQSVIQQLEDGVSDVEASRVCRHTKTTLEIALQKFRFTANFGTGRFRDAREWAAKTEKLLSSIRLPEPLGVAEWETKEPPESIVADQRAENDDNHL